MLMQVPESLPLHGIGGLRVLAQSLGRAGPRVRSCLQFAYSPVRFAHLFPQVQTSGQEAHHEPGHEKEDKEAQGDNRDRRASSKGWTNEPYQVSALSHK